MTIPVTGIAHVRITVTDLEASKAFYDSLFGWDVAYSVPADADDVTKEQLSFLFGGIIYSYAGGLFGLRPVAEGAFDEDRTGLDHLAFSLASLDDLTAAASTLDGLGVAHEGIKDIGGASILEFRDPDNIALELFAPNA